VVRMLRMSCARPAATVADGSMRCASCSWRTSVLRRFSSQTARLAHASWLDVVSLWFFVLALRIRDRSVVTAPKWATRTREKDSRSRSEGTAVIVLFAAGCKDFGTRKAGPCVKHSGAEIAYGNETVPVWPKSLPKVAHLDSKRVPSWAWLKAIVCEAYHAHGGQQKGPPSREAGPGFGEIQRRTFRKRSVAAGGK
jgi:hypothetical protein